MSPEDDSSAHDSGEKPNPASDGRSASVHGEGTREVEHTSTGRPILVAPARRSRPLKTLAGRDGASGCPFCPGSEAETPPERSARRATGTAPDTPGWVARAFPNKYPAAPFHEVIAEGATHETRPGRLDLETWQQCVDLWHERVLWFERQPGVAFAFLFKNVGREAGASIAHNHSQLIGMPELAPRLQLEREQDRRHGSLVGRELERAEPDARVLFESTHHVAFAPRSPRLPGEMWLAPTRSDGLFEDGEQLGDLAASLRRMCRAIDGALQAPPLNFWLHRIPGDSSFHWHFEFQPRTGFLAGLELGADAYINALSATESVAALRAALED